jgi:hypothetical protein
MLRKIALVLLVASAVAPFANANCTPENPNVICAAECYNGGSFPECATLIGTPLTTACYQVSPTTGCITHHDDCHCEDPGPTLF